MAVPKKLILYDSNDQIVEIDGLQDGTVTPATYINNAVVTATLYDSSGATVSGLNNVTMNYVAASNGNYRGNVPNTFSPPIGGGYVLKLDGNVSGIKFHIEIAVEIKTRTS
jgi:hypothetical protein